jgi:hypothetical protein
MRRGGMRRVRMGGAGCGLRLRGAGWAPGRGGGMGVAPRGSMGVAFEGCPGHGRVYSWGRPEDSKARGGKWGVLGLTCSLRRTKPLWPARPQGLQ